MRGYLHVVVDHDGHCANREFAELPRLCPACRQQVQPYRLTACSTDADDRAVDFAFQCPRTACRRLFVASYHLGDSGEFELDRVTPDTWQTMLVSVRA